MTEAVKPSGLALLREPFPHHQISKLPKGTKAQNECPYEQKRSCKICGGFHHPDIKHLDYVGHAALTYRLLDADPAWLWEPAAKTTEGLPVFDSIGGLWIRLTVCGVTRLGYGNAEKKPHMDVGAREKEAIGDALRNAAMRFGAALDLWHKGDLELPEPISNSELEAFVASINGAKTIRELREAGEKAMRAALDAQDHEASKAIHAAIDQMTKKAEAAAQAAKTKSHTLETKA
jgi:hypothetical protein